MLWYLGLMEEPERRPRCQKCGRLIAPRKLDKGRRVGVVPAYCAERCKNAAKQARHRQKLPITRQDRIHLRNLAAHGMIAEKLLRDPHVLDIARDNIRRWVEQNGPTEALEQWALLIESDDRAAILHALLRVDEEGMRLRSSSPFAGVLDDTERKLIFEAARK